MGTGKGSLRLIRGGRDELRFGTLRVAVASRDSAPFPVEADVVEEDTWQVLGATPEVTLSTEHPVRVMTELLSAAPIPVGSVVTREGKPLRLVAVVHDLGQEPSCCIEWVEAALGEILRIAEARSLRSLSLPLLGVRHGRLPLAGFIRLLAGLLREPAPRSLRRLWLVVPEEMRDEVRSLLAEEEP